jgi:hypothetical protein
MKPSEFYYRYATHLDFSRLPVLAYENVNGQVKHLVVARRLPDGCSYECWHKRSGTGEHHTRHIEGLMIKEPMQ